MPLYLISYDLLNHATFGQYETLIAELERIGCRKALYSQWAVRRDETSEVLRNHLQQYIHTTDRILVSEITANWASLHLLINLNNL
jgi:hypothetical protein